MIRPARGEEYWNRRTQRISAVTNARKGHVRLVDRRGAVWFGTDEEFWSTWLHAAAHRARWARSRVGPARPAREA